MITQELLKEYLTYNPDTGEFIRNKSTANNAKKGDVAVIVIRVMKEHVNANS